MTGEMHKVDRTDGPGNRDEVDLVGSCEKQRNVADSRVIQADPQVGISRVAVLVVSFRYVLPTSGAIIPANVAQDTRIVHSDALKPEAVH